ncbi:hypothetical protein AOLI_G00097970 [Acnodon oligacanthus]
MPMGLTNAPPTFQRLMELVLHGLHWKECLIYLDDVLVFSWTFSQHLDSLEEVLGRFYTAGLKLKASKCSFACSQVTFLGYVVLSQGLQPGANAWIKFLTDPTLQPRQRHFKHFLAGTTFTIVTDHKPLLSLQKAAVESNPTGRGGRWILELGVYDYTVIHKEGKKHANADAMSRRPCFRMETKAIQCVLTTLVAREMVKSTGDKEDVKHIPDICPTLSIDPDDMRKNQEADGTLCTVRAWMEVGRHRPHLGSLKGRSAAVRKLWHEFPKLSLRNGILCRKFKCSLHTMPVYQVVLPDVLILTALKALHGNEFNGHLGADHTLQRAQRICYWPHMSRDIHKFCSKCLPCQTRSSPTPHEQTLLQSIHANRPFQSIAPDITELPITSKGHRYVLVIMDYFTPYINLFPLKD